MFRFQKEFGKSVHSAARVLHIFRGFFRKKKLGFFLGTKPLFRPSVAEMRFISHVKMTFCWDPSQTGREIK